MQFDAKQYHTHTEYMLFVSWLADAAVASLEAAKGNEKLVRAAIDEFLTRGYEAGLTSGELIDFFAVDTPNVLERAGYDGTNAEEAVRVFDDLNSRSHRALEMLERLGAGGKKGVYLKAPSTPIKLQHLEKTLIEVIGPERAAELIKFFGITDGCQINNATFQRAQNLSDFMDRVPTGMILLGDDETAYFVLDRDDARYHMILEGDDKKFKSFDTFEKMLLMVMKEQGVI